MKFCYLSLIVSMTVLSECAPIPVGVVHAALVAQYTFDTDFTDSAGSIADNGTAVGGASIQSGTVMVGSGALKLDGKFNRVDLNVAGELDFDLVNDSYSVAIWAYLQSSSRRLEHWIFGQDPDSGIGRTWLVLIEPSPNKNNAVEDTPYEYLGGPGGQGRADVETPRDAWQHLVLTQDNTDLSNPLTSLYVNGVLANTSSDPPEAASGGKFRIGHHKEADNTGSSFKGFIDDLRIYDTAITGQEVAALFAMSAGGDFDVDGDVDGADFLEWQRGLGSSFDATDLNNWESEFGTTQALSAVLAVPEPSSLLMASTLIAFFVRFRPVGQIEK